MEVFTPQEVARYTGSKYRGILVAAKFARYLNEFPRDVVASWEHTEGAKKLTTLSLQKLIEDLLKWHQTRAAEPATVGPVELPDVVRRVLREQKLAALDDADAGADVGHFGQDVGRKEDRLAHLLQLAQ